MPEAVRVDVPPPSRPVHRLEENDYESTEIEFRCPECGGNTICETSQAVQYAWLNTLWRYPDSTRWYPEYYDADTDIVEVTKTECANCGFLLQVGPLVNLGSFLIENGWIQDTSDILPENEPTWEV